MKQFIFNLISMIIGSFLVVGILESYKNDEKLKDAIIDKYFEPATASLNECLSLNIQYINTYKESLGNYQIIMNGMEKLISEPEILKNQNYILWITTILTNKKELKDKLDKLTTESQKCYEKNSLNFEKLTIVTGEYRRFIISVDKQKKLINENNAHLNQELNNLSLKFNFDEKNIFLILDELFKSDFKESKKIQDLLKYKESISDINSKKVRIEEENFNIIQNTFIAVKISSAEKINDMYRTTFIKWLLKLFNL